MKKIAAVFVTGLLIYILLLGVMELPHFGLPSNPSNNELMKYYIEKATEDTGVMNIVTGIILDYRAFDTFVEASVLFTAAAAVLMLLREKRQGSKAEVVEGNLILKEISQIIIPFIYIFGIYLMVFGHLSPGGGFAGGTILGTGLILYSAAYGYDMGKKYLSYNRLMKIMVGSIVLYGMLKGYSFVTGGSHINSYKIPLGTPGNILSGGLILPLNIMVGMIVSITIYLFYVLFDKGEIQ